IAANALAAGILIGWTIENVLLESFGWGGWVRSVLLTATAATAPLAGAAALATGAPIPSFARVLSDARTPDRLQLGLGAIFILLTVLAIQVALGLVFDPRYRDFPFAPLTAATVPFLILTLLRAAPAGGRGAAELAAAALLGLSAVYIAINESLANWQALWFCAVLAALAVILFRVRDGRG
ncbi:MAG: hypothetical protein ACREBP_02760, partial [Sphingomicrobium sp.]